MANITTLATAGYMKGEAERQTAAAVNAQAEAAHTMQVHAAYARRVCAAELLKRGQPMTPEALAATVDVELALVRVVLDGLALDGEIVQTGALYAWPRRAA